MRKIAFVVVIAALTQGCSTSRAQRLDYAEVADELPVPRGRGFEQAHAHWITLCQTRHCSSEAVELSRVFHEAAMLATAVEALEGQHEAPQRDSDLLNSLVERAADTCASFESLPPAWALPGAYAEAGRRGMAIAGSQLTRASAGIRRILDTVATTRLEVWATNHWRDRRVARTCVALFGWTSEHAPFATWSCRLRTPLGRLACGPGSRFSTVPRFENGARHESDAPRSGRLASEVIQRAGAG